MTKDQFFAIEYEDFLGAMETAAECVINQTSDLENILWRAKDRFYELSFCARMPKDASEAGRVCVVDSDAAVELMYDILMELDECRERDGRAYYDDKHVRNAIDMLFAIPEEERDEEVAS